ncbi:TonB-dependent receptor plug domain-containing protein [Pseudomonas aeruginosa]|nr:TonB-dependent receptor plug domain-containing protein [Pseudomonas aeruginosa]
MNDEESVVLDSITVTARKREENLNDVPGSVHVETGRDLERKRMLDGAAALRDVAGASVGIFGDRSNAFVVLRGVAPILTPLSPDDSSVLTFVDGAPMPIGASFSPYLDLERMEVMKGPQSTLFGRNTSGGAINLVPVKPNHEFEASVRGEGGPMASSALKPSSTAHSFRKRYPRAWLSGAQAPTATSTTSPDATWERSGPGPRAALCCSRLPPGCDGS